MSVTLLSWADFLFAFEILTSDRRVEFTVVWWCLTVVTIFKLKLSRGRRREVTSDFDWVYRVNLLDVGVETVFHHVLRTTKEKLRDFTPFRADSVVFFDDQTILFFREQIVVKRRIQLIYKPLKKAKILCKFLKYKKWTMCSIF